MPYDMATSSNSELDANVGDERPPGFTPVFSFPMDPANSARQDDDRSAAFCAGCRQSHGVKRLLCSHTVCGSCFLRNEIGVCPLCGLITPMEFIKDMSKPGQRGFRSIAEQAIRCNCQAGVAGSYFCQNCNEFLCTRCSGSHTSVPAFSGHQIEEVTEAALQLTFMAAICPVHEQILSWYCHHCQRMACKHCAALEHQDHQERLADLANASARGLFFGLVAAHFPSKMDLLRKRHDEIKQRVQEVEQNRAAAKSALDTVREFLLKRFEELASEVDRKFQAEDARYSGILKRTRDLMMMASLINRLVAKANTEQTLEDHSFLQLLDYILSRSNSIDDLLNQPWQEPIPVFAHLVNILMHQAATLGSLAPASDQPRFASPPNRFAYYPQQPPAIPNPMTRPNFITQPLVGSAPVPHPTRIPSYRFPMPGANVRPGHVSATAPRGNFNFQNPQHFQLQQPQQRQVFDLAPPQFRQAGYMPMRPPQQQMPYQHQLQQQFPFNAPGHQLSAIQTGPGPWPSCGFQTQPVIRSSRGPIQPPQVGPTVAQEQQQAPMDLSRQYRVNTNAVNIPTAKTPPATMSEMTPLRSTSEATAPPSTLSSTITKQTVGTSDTQSRILFNNILAEARMHSTVSSPPDQRKKVSAKLGRICVSTFFRPLAQKPTRKRLGGMKAKIGRRVAIGTLTNITDFLVPQSVTSVVDELAMKRQANNEIARDNLAQLLQRSCHAELAVATVNAVRTQAVSIQIPPTASALINAESPSPTESRLVIDESDSGVESAITVEEDAETGLFGKVKQEKNASAKRVVFTRTPENGTAAPSAEGPCSSNLADRPSTTALQLDKLSALLPPKQCIREPQPVEAGRDSGSISEEDFWDDVCCVCNLNDGPPTRRCGNTGCGRLFHGNHHVPPFRSASIDGGSSPPWYCTFCIDLDRPETGTDSAPAAEVSRLTTYQQQVCQRILIELYCCPQSIIFHQPADKKLVGYYEQIRHPIDFGTIRQKLVDHKYAKIDEFLADLNLSFNNCYVYYKDLNPEICVACRAVGEFYRSLVARYFPESVDRIILFPVKRKNLASESSGDRTREASKKRYGEE